MEREKIVLFLYTRLPDYFFQCIQHFVGSYAYKAVVICYREDKNTKYSFSENDRIQLYYKDELDIEKFMTEINPAAIFVSGWGDKTYKQVVKKRVKEIPVIMGLDNPWTGDLRQKLLCRLAPLFIHPFFNYVWVAGNSQYEYARKLGFDRHSILNGLYVADTNKFYKETVDKETSSYPHTVVYVGRMVAYKRPHILAEVFNEIIDSYKLDWRLIMVGEGPLKEEIHQKNYSHVKLLDFIAPEDLPAFYKDAGIFCLPSKGEHWGVAVQEAAAAGLPLLLSDTVDAGSLLLLQGYNGFLFPTDDASSLKTTLLRIMQMPKDGLVSMSRNSVLLSKKLDHATWSATLNSVLVKR